MIKLNRHLAIFLSLFALLATSVAVASQKFLFLTLHRTAYYCQAFLRSFSSPVPFQLGLTIVALLVFIVLVCLAKILWIYWQSHNFKQMIVLSPDVPVYFQELVDKLGLAGKVYLAKNKKPFAVCAGIRNPKIYVSTGLTHGLTTLELEAVLLHEKYHLDNRDSLTLLVASVTQFLLPFFPIVKDLLFNYRIDREIKADQEAISKIGSARPIISVLRKLLMTESFPLAAIPALADKDTLESRIKALVFKDFSFKKFNNFHVLVSLVSLLIFTAIAIVPVQAVEIHDSQGQDVMMICPSGNDCVLWCQKNKTIEPYSSMPNASHPFTP